MGGTTHGVTVRKATAADIDGPVASITGLFAVDSVRDRLRNPDWPQAHAADDETKNVANSDMLVLLAERDGSVIGHFDQRLLRFVSDVDRTQGTPDQHARHDRLARTACRRAPG
jgi:hypothetical protein